MIFTTQHALPINLLAWMLLSISATGTPTAQAQSPFDNQPLPASQTNTSNVTPESTLNLNSQPPRSPGLNDSLSNRKAETATTADPSSARDTMPVVLSVDQLLRILDGNPSLVVEVKSAIADRLSEQGRPLNANNITDEQLYTQLGASAELRAGVTSYLRARGYVSPEQIEAATVSNTIARPGNLTSSDLYSSPASGSTPETNPLFFPGSTTVGAARAAGTSTEESPTRADADRQGRTRSSTDAPAVLRRPTPYNLESLRDIYTQLPHDDAPLHRFGSELFTGHTSSAIGHGSVSDLPTDVPLGPDYIVGAGDTLSINLWGSTTQSLSRTVGRDGTVLLPEAGSVQVAGLSLGHVQALIEGAFAKQFRGAQVSVTVSRLRTVRVYIVGDVQRPGGYDLSSLATPLGALYAAGGPTAAGSLRLLRHMRGPMLVEEIDLYAFLLAGVRPGGAQFQSGDTLDVPPVGPLVAISGAVRRQGIYELGRSPANLQTVIDEAGGTVASASLDHITLERIDAQGMRRTLTLPMSSTPDARRAALATFSVQDGDRVHIGAILPFSEKVVYLAGHVLRPGRMPFREGLSLHDLLSNSRDLLPEAADRGEIIRLVPPDLHADTLLFDLKDVLIGNQNLSLQPFDTVRLFGRYEQEAPTVTVTGEVERPGMYPMSQGMTAGALVRMAGGFKRAALQDTADLTSYTIQHGERVEGSLATVRIGAAVSGTDPTADQPLKPGDVLTVREITGWNDIGQSITLEGQVRFPGTYGFREGERLSTVLRRAGGLRETAYPEGAVLVRTQVRELEEKSRDELIRQIQTTAASARLSPNLAASGDASTSLQVIKAQQDEVLAQLKAHPPTGRMVIHIGTDIDHWANTTDDVELRRGDVLNVPKRPGFVLVSGQVYNSTALSFTPGKTAAWYLGRAGGANSSADRKDTFVIRANGTVVGRRSGSGLFSANVMATRMEPGDVVVVPQKIIGPSVLWRNLLTTAQLASSIAITAAVSGL